MTLYLVINSGKVQIRKSAATATVYIFEKECVNLKDPACINGIYDWLIEKGLVYIDINGEKKLTDKGWQTYSDTKAELLHYLGKVLSRTNWTNAMSVLEV